MTNATELPIEDRLLLLELHVLLIQRHMRGVAHQMQLGEKVMDQISQHLLNEGYEGPSVISPRGIRKV